MIPSVEKRTSVDSVPEMEMYIYIYVCMICFQCNSDFVAKFEILKGANRTQQFDSGGHTLQKQRPDLDTISCKQNLQETTATPITPLIQQPAGHRSRNSNVWMGPTLDPPGFSLSLSIGHMGVTPIRLLPRTENRVPAPALEVSSLLSPDWNLCLMGYLGGWNATTRNGARCLWFLGWRSGVRRWLPQTQLMDSTEPSPL